MWLIRVKDEVLVSFVFENAPRYAILSHRWDDKNPEVTFNDMQNPLTAQGMLNYSKIRQTCNQAAKHGLQYAWIDTCCIDKSSSAELSEAINSMFRWYQHAAFCYAFLADVERPAHCDFNHLGYSLNASKAVVKSEWFERGWTLQELIAPERLVFFDKSWKPLGTKKSLLSDLSEKTGIDMDTLSGAPLSRISLACRMSWASERKTTRVEDTAYCLLGIFDINMPMLYGEGDKAFLRLQEEIIRRSDDQTIFAWPLPTMKSQRVDKLLHGLLADSPAAFKACGGLEVKTPLSSLPGHVVSSRGVSLHTRAMLCSTDTYLIRLNCSFIKKRHDDDWNDTQFGHVAIWVVRLSEKGQFARVPSLEGKSHVQLPSATWSIDKELRGEAVGNLLVDVPQQFEEFNRWNGGYELPIPALPRWPGFKFCEPRYFRWDNFQNESLWHWDEEKSVLSVNIPGEYETACVYSAGVVLQGATLRNASRSQLVSFQLAFDLEGHPICFVITNGADVRLSGMNLQHAFLRAENPLRWSEGSSDTKHIFLQCASHKGLWAVKGNKMQGLFARLAISAAEGPIGTVTVTRTTSTHRGKQYLLWSVEVNGFEGYVSGHVNGSFLARALIEPPTRDLLKEIREHNMQDPRQRRAFSSAGPIFRR